MAEYFLKKWFKDSISYLKELKLWILYVVLFFFLFSLFGFFVSPSEEIYSLLTSFFKDLIEKTSGMSFFQLFWFILQNNFQASFLGLCLGVFFGVVPIFFMLINGYVLGFASRLSVNAEGVLSLWRLFPHGIFELPALFLSIAFGIKLGAFLFYPHKLKYLKFYFKKSIKAFLVIVIPLLIIAAFIETLFIVFS